jgi:hypothetical protein
MTLALRPSVRLWVLVPALVALGSVVLDFVLLEFVGAFFLPILGLLAYVGVGLLLTLRLPRQPVGWLLLGAGALFQLTFAASAYAWAAFIRAPGTLPLGEVALLMGFAWIPALGCLFLAIMVFPTGRLPSRRWRLPAALVVMATALLMVSSALGQREFLVPQSATEGPGASPLTVANPFWTGGALAMLLSTAYGSPFVYVAYLIPVAAVVARFRTAAGSERQQLKWFAYTSSIAIVVGGPGGVLFPYLAGLGPLIAILAIDLIPISVAIAILRYRLYDIDLIVKRTLVYGATSAAIALTFFLGLVALQAALRPLTTGSELAVAASTLFSFALFQPVRSRVQNAVDLRFDRSRYDAARTLDTFADLLRDEVDLDAVRADLLGAVQLNMAPAHLSLWLRERAR